MGINRDLRSLTLEELLALAVHHRLILRYEVAESGVRLYARGSAPMEMGRMEAALFLAGALSVDNPNPPEEPPEPLMG